jgi:hypothetical protein
MEIVFHSHNAAGTSAWKVNNPSSKAAMDFLPFLQSSLAGKQETKNEFR